MDSVTTAKKFQGDPEFSPLGFLFLGVFVALAGVTQAVSCVLWLIASCLGFNPLDEE